MVDPIEPKASASVDRRFAPVTPVSALPVPHSAAQADVVRAAPTVHALTKPAAAAPPVDLERVARIKKAIQDGTFPLLSATIADRLLALKLDWKPHDPA